MATSYAANKNDEDLVTSTWLGPGPTVPLGTQAITEAQYQEIQAGGITYPGGQLRWLLTDAGDLLQQTDERTKMRWEFDEFEAVVGIDPPGNVELHALEADGEEIDPDFDETVLLNFGAPFQPISADFSNGIYVFVIPTNTGYTAILDDKIGYNFLNSLQITVRDQDLKLIGQ